MEGQCAFCGLSNQVRICKNPDTGKGPQFCSTLLYPECIEKAAEEYQSEEIHTFAVNSAKNERSCYDCRTAHSLRSLPQRMSGPAIIAAWKQPDFPSR